MSSPENPSGNESPETGDSEIVESIHNDGENHTSEVGDASPRSGPQDDAPNTEILDNVGDSLAQVDIEVAPVEDERAVSPSSVEEQVASTVDDIESPPATVGNGDDAQDAGPTTNGPLSPPDPSTPAAPPITDIDFTTGTPPRLAPPYGDFRSPSPPPRTGCLSRLEPIISILTYPIMVLVTVIMLIMVITFCIFPTLLCMMLGICLYYCLREDPIPLSVLLRYMLSPDADDHPDYPNSYALAQRPVIAAKLIVRRVLHIDDIGDDDTPKKDQDYSRRHPLPIKVWTDHKCLHFSEPVTVDENENDATSGIIGGAQEDGTPSLNVHIPHYQRTEEPLTTLSEPQNSSATNPQDLEAGNDNGDIYPTDEGDVELGTITRASLMAPEDVVMLQDEEIVIGGSDGIENKNPESPKNDLESNTTEKSEMTSNRLVGESPGDSGPGGVGNDYFGIQADIRDRGTTCDICLLEYQVGDTVAWSPNVECIHAFHRDCILDWLVRKPSCPNCRVDYLKGKHDEDL